jgi:hypothetical protein
MRFHITAAFWAQLLPKGDSRTVLSGHPIKKSRRFLSKRFDPEVVNNNAAAPASPFLSLAELKKKMMGTLPILAINKQCDPSAIITADDTDIMEEPDVGVLSSSSCRADQECVVTSEFQFSALGGICVTRGTGRMLQQTEDGVCAMFGDDCDCADLYINGGTITCVDACTTGIITIDLAESSVSVARSECMYSTEGEFCMDFSYSSADNPQIQGLGGLTLALNGQVCAMGPVVCGGGYDDSTSFDCGDGAITGTLCENDDSDSAFFSCPAYFYSQQCTDGINTGHAGCDCSKWDSSSSNSSSPIIKSIVCPIDLCGSGTYSFHTERKTISLSGCYDVGSGSQICYNFYEPANACPLTLDGNACDCAPVNCTDDKGLQHEHLDIDCGMGVVVAGCDSDFDPSGNTTGVCLDLVDTPVLPPSGVPHSRLYTHGLIAVGATTILLAQMM